MNYKIQIIQLADSRKFKGEVWIDNRLRIETMPMTSEIVAIRQLNKKIEAYNHANGLVGKRALPLHPEINKHPPLTNKDKMKSARHTTQLKETESTATTKAKHTVRKPYTPYGLKGYMVDKHGNVRLMLDRKANAHTIVLRSEMFSALADMVRQTQQQDVLGGD